MKVIGQYLVENNYEIINEAKNASLLGYGNGYFGIRGSLEEFGDVFVQGTYIRGVFDKIIEIPATLSTNEYMKKYYFDAQKLKEFEREDSCINIADFTTVRVYLNGKMFLPWEFKILKWERYIDFNDGGLTRIVIFEDDKGNQTKLLFKAICSFNNNHVFFQEVKIEKLNHNELIEVEYGVDTLVKTNGQHKSILKKVSNKIDGVRMLFYEGDTYNMYVGLASKNITSGLVNPHLLENNKVYSTKAKMNTKIATYQKIVYCVATPDVTKDTDLYELAFKELKKLPSFDEIKSLHLKSYKKEFEKIDIKIKGDKEFDVILRYCNYQTLIGIDRFDVVHSLSAKNLTAEKYNQFVWWDAEILQLPIFLASMPEYTKNVLMYRYNRLKEAKKIAAKDGYDGAKFAFCSSVDGRENVWIYARHPFLQIHSTADVGYGIINYYRHTLDKEFMIKYGLKMLIEIDKYFISRMEKSGNQYHINNVTGTDEHHPYINNNAYTNYEVSFLLKETIRFINKFDYKIDDKLFKTIEDCSNKLYLPKDKNGLIPQFDGYFKLKPYLPIVGKNAPGFQMKANGLYHLSQIIKQPDVMNIYSYLDIGLKDGYKKNWKYYEKMCEASSSLTYPVHALCSIDNNEYDKWRDYLNKSLRIDIEDIHNCAKDGVHAGCIAGGYFNIYRGLCGFKAHEEYLEVNPHFDTFIEKAEFNFVYHGISVHVTINKKELILSSDNHLSFNLLYNENMIVHRGKTVIKKELQ